jgi:hypothetical protein
MTAAIQKNAYEIEPSVHLSIVKMYLFCHKVELLRCVPVSQTTYETAYRMQRNRRRDGGQRHAASAPSRDVRSVQPVAMDAHRVFKLVDCAQHAQAGAVQLGGLLPHDSSP